jgi:hypothetical protein
MDDPLQGLIRELRSERCPDTVQERAERRIAALTTAGRRRPHLFAWALAGTALVLCVALPTLRNDPPAGASLPIAGTPPKPDRDHDRDRALALAQTQGALLAIGRILIDTGAHTEKALLETAAPPILEGFHSLKTKLTHPL